MAVQSSFYVPDGSTRTFPSTKHIATKQHVGVYLQRALDSVWETALSTSYELVNNSIVFDSAVDNVLYIQIEMRVVDTTAELIDSPSNIALVAASITDVNTVADSILDVNTVATNIGSVQNTSAISANITTVAGVSGNVTTVANSIANVNTTAINIANVNAVGLDLLEPTSEINTVAVNIADVNTVGLAIASVNTVAGISGNVTTVAGVSGNVTTIANSIASVNAVATNIADINSVATTIVPNIAEILLADDNATVATAQAGIAATQATNASSSATQAQLSEWGAEAERLTADSYATEAEDTFVNLVTSDGDGTFTYTPTTDYSALHWAAKSMSGDIAPIIHAASSKTTPVDADEFALVDSGASYGLKKVTFGSLKSNLNSGYKNFIINGSMAVQQYPTFTATDGYKYDRWMVSNASNLGSLFQAQLNGESSSDKALSFTKTVEGITYFLTRIEFPRRLSGKTVTVSFRAYSNTGYPMPSVVYFDKYNPTDGQTNATPGQSFTWDNSWNKRSFTFTLPTLGSNFNNANSYFQLVIAINSGTTSGAYLTDVQLEEGTVSTPFEQRPYGLELSLCQRYYEVVPCINWAYSAVSTPGAAGALVKFTAIKRVAPTAGTITILSSTGTNTYSIDSIGTSAARFVYNSTQSGIVGASGSVPFSAEL